MPKISVITTVITFFEVPEGLTIEQVRHAGLADLSEMEEIVDDIVASHDRVMNRIYMGDALSHSCSIEHAITDTAEPLNPA
ncbi:hypothetical protein [Pseudomonas petrae]|uniref:hypothetical protein n=1 Tax=Pseudomonas petrae TaxID=2912190 RepID=UPI001F2F7679|nr:hypothetical protein [Pseudomonas petrae]MCF7536210.1 hypothetical protein [Pseudomonas petrae]